ncbi:MAG: hypothetical protein CL666_04400 [Balneola sp.]|nr:hypothetical protein [Balneola sp.]|tara:strand:- start:45878 stop:46930 length:1053 start_codon:yes stop_codon:yes gene_type:complete
MHTIIKGLFIFIILLPSLGLAQGINFPDGLYRDISPGDFKEKNLSSKYYNELWTYHANMDNGMQVIVNFSINDFGSAYKGRVTGGKLMLNMEDGTNYVVNKEYSLETFTNEPDSNFIDLHPERTFWAKGKFDESHRVRYRTKKDGILYDVDLTYYDIVPGKVLGNGKYEFGSNEIGLYLLIPHAKVKGFVAINGDTTQVSGTGYMDHIYQNNLSNEIIKRSYRVKSGDAQDGFYFHFLTLKESNLQTPIGYGVRMVNNNVYLLTPSFIEQVSRDSSPRELDSVIRVDPFQGDDMNIEVTELLQTYSLLNELGGIKRFLAKQVVGGELVEMNGRVIINNSTPGYFYYMAPK